MPLKESSAWGEPLDIGRIDDGEYVRRVGDELRSATPLPVGFVFISVLPDNPRDQLGYGTWSPLAAGRVLVGVDSTDPDFDTVRKLSGTKTHALTVDELPAHSHGLTRIRGLGTGSQGTDYSGIASGTDPSSTPTPVATDVAGLGAAHNNLQPGLTVYMWERVA